MNAAVREAVIPSEETLLERARALVPALRQRAVACQANRAVPAETIAFPFHTPTEAMAIFSTFGMGIPFALIGASSDSKGSDLTLELSESGVIALNMARLGSGKFAATGRLTTLGDPIPPLKTQLLFSHTDPTGVFVPATPYPRLEFETVPEPSSLLALSLFGLLACRRRAKSKRSH